jgi:hypothetical protein
MPRFLSRRPPIVAPPELIDQPGLAFGITVGSEPAGWTVTAFGADGRRLGRPLKSLSDSAASTLTTSVDAVSDTSARVRLADAWVQACRTGVTNADVLTDFADAAARIASGAE